MNEFMQIVTFVFSDFWTWLGTFLLLCAFRPLAGIVRVTHAGARLIDKDAMKLLVEYGKWKIGARTVSIKTASESQDKRP